MRDMKTFSLFSLKGRNDMGIIPISCHDVLPAPEFLLKLAKARMPFGKYKDCLLIDLPEPYVVWFAGQGFPGGELGEMLRMVYEIKVNGLEYLFDRLRD